MRRCAPCVRMRRQHTLCHAVEMQGVGLHSGKPVQMAILPAPAGTGVVFSQNNQHVPAHYRNVAAAELCTTIRSDDNGAAVATVEHLLAALATCGVNNCEVVISGPEVPILDGSMLPFVQRIQEVGVEHQDCPTPVIQVVRPVHVRSRDGNASLEPLPAQDLRHPELVLSVDVDFSQFGLRRRQFSCTCRYDPQMISEVGREGEVSLFHDVAPARTFTFLSLVEKLKEMGLIRGGSLDNAVVFDDSKAPSEAAPMNIEGLRFTDEWVRHKALDALGDLYLAGAPLHAQYHGERPGHALNAALLEELFSSHRNYVIHYL